jgi:hypothetical protein
MIIPLFERDNKLEHQPPDTSYGCPLSNLLYNDRYDDDVYGPNGWKYYGEGRPKEDNANFAIIRRYKNKPDDLVRIFRAVPKEVNEIEAGDWVAITRDYAMTHLRHVASTKTFKIISKLVKASEVWTGGDSFNEWGYWPES